MNEDIIGTLADDYTKVAIARSNVIPPEPVQPTSSSVVPGASSKGLLYGGLALMAVILGVVIYKAVK